MIDYAIIGAGPIGLALACSLKLQLGEHRHVAIIDGGPVAQTDNRWSAIAKHPSQMLSALGVWSPLSEHRAHIDRMLISDCRFNDDYKPVYLEFNGNPLSYMVNNQQLKAALHKRALELGVEMHLNQSVFDIQDKSGYVTIGEKSARLVVLATGGNTLAAQAQIKHVSIDSDQSAITCNLRHARDNKACATSYFYPSGPLAFLPIGTNEASIVWCNSRAETARLLKLDPAQFAAKLADRLGKAMGKFEITSPILSWPITTSIARSLFRGRIALVGDCAAKVHPLAGQGINLGLRGAAQLTECLVESARRGADAGEQSTLENYERMCRFNNSSRALFFQFLNQLFSPDADVSRLIRDAGLGLTDRTPLVKSYFQHLADGQAIGESEASMPSLFRAQVLS